MSLADRHIRVFLSSVFNGMDKEREYFRTTLQPRAQKLCKDYAVTFTFIDLRWGITDSENLEQLVLHRCLEEIDKSARSPCFFIGLIGNHYGTAFGKQQIESYLTSPSAKYAQWLDEKLQDQSVGVTDLEFLYAEDIARQYPALKPLYYIRDDARDRANHLLQEQIRRIERFTDYLAIDGYSSLEVVGEHFLGRLEDLLKENFSFGDIVDPYDRSKRAVLNEMSVEGIETDIFLETLRHARSRQQATTGPLFLQGNAGSGKTFLLTQLQQTLEPQDSEPTILCLGNFDDPIGRALKEIGTLPASKLDEMWLGEKVAELKQALERHTGRLLVLLDAVDSDKLAFDPSVPNHDVLLRLLHGIKLGEGVGLVVSYQSKCTFRPDFSIDGLTDRNLEEFVSSFGERFGKTIPDEVLDVFKNNPTLRLPIAASLIFAQLVQATNEDEVWETVQHIEQNQQDKQHEDAESGWDDLVRFFIRDIVKDYPKVDAKDLSEKLPALLNDYMGTDGISIADLARECGIAEAVVLEVTERLRPALYIVDDHFRSRKEFFTGLNEANLESRINLVQRHWQNQEDAFLALLLRNMETYFYWVLGGRSKVEEWLGDYEKDLITPSRALMFYAQDYTNFRRLMLLLRYINPIHYLSLCSNIDSEPLVHESTALKIIRDPFIVIEYPLFCLAMVQRLKQSELEHPEDLNDLEDIKDLYRFALSYQAFMVSRRKGLGHEFAKPRASIAQEFEQGSSLEAFLNFKDFGEVVYDTVLYKTYLAEGFLRFSDFERNVASHLENNVHAGYIYGKLLSVHDGETEDDILAREKQFYRELFQEDPEIRREDKYTRNHLRTYLETP